MGLRDQVEAHAAACRAAYMLDREWPQWAAGPLSGADLSNADLRWAFLRGANLSDADLSGADLSDADLRGAGLTGARLTEGTATGRAISGEDGGYRWWAVVLEGGDAVLQYGCARRLLSWWLAQGPALSVSHGHPPEHWQEGPAVAIAAAQRVSAGEPPARLGGVGLRGAQRRKLKKVCGPPLPV